MAITRRRIPAPNKYTWFKVMEELTGPNVQVVLGIKEGNGFSQLENPTVIVATLNGHSLETDLVDPDLHPQYATDLVWDADKSGVRKMRVDHVPLKLECFAVDDSGLREKIGYILLPLRSAQIIPRDKSTNVKVSWHKLLGVKSELRVSVPEILLSLTIEDREMVSGQSYSNIQQKAELEMESTLSTVSATPRLLHEERLIQLGPDSTSRDLFLLSITAGKADHLEYLVQRGVNDLRENFSFWYQILNNDIQLKSFKKLPDKSHTLNEKIVIRIRSCLNVLKHYFQENPYLLVKLQYGNTLVGQCKVDLRSLVPSENITDYSNNSSDTSMALDQKCYLAMDNVTESIPKGKPPSVEIQLRLQYVGYKSVNSKSHIKSQDPSSNVGAENYDVASYLAGNSWVQHADLDIKDSHHYRNSVDKTKSEIEAHRNPGGDFGKCISLNQPVGHFKNPNKHSSSCEVIKEQAADVIFSHSADAILHSASNKECSRSIKAYHCYCLSILLESIKFSQELATENINFCFHHPKAQLVSILQRKIPGLSTKKLSLQDIQCKLHFVSSADEIGKLLISFPPRVSICNAEDNVEVCLAQAVLDVTQLFNKSKPQCKLGVPLLGSDEKEIGILDVKMSLEDCGPYHRTKRGKTDEDLGPPILDDSLAYKIVEELETWKERQQEIFRVELKRKEERHLNLLSDEWQKRRQVLETKLACSVEQCKMLANSLNNATEDLRIRRLKSLEKEARLIKANEDLQWRYDHKLQELREASQRLQDDLNHKLSILEEQKNVLEAKVEPLQLENDKLKNIVSQLTEELEVYQKGSLTQDQTALLLQELKGMEEKLNNTQKSKSFFKEQWGKAVREIHRMKMDHQQAVEVHIKNSKEELKNIDLEDVLCTDSKELLNDQILLGEIQQEINVIKPKPAFMQMNMDDQAFIRPSNLYSKSSHSMARSEMSARSEEIDEKLKNLIEERDSLLKTGSYSIDDTVIMKLNNEIRSLLITS
ncbi:centrosomal protein of 120 kDa isoform X1 [Neodiprion lecontei]|uniref:Centrosomal protein of 120 kDa isoform X1 n=2 Tax=Neodiprion lecontei TaxID=441921 RepID=A0A6J0BU41_NEOLC|nr:centrosomal protein of 120 kDa isoform X1 [Neodiprion lecontei]